MAGISMSWKFSWKLINVPGRLFRKRGYEVLIFLFFLSLNAVKFDVKPTVSEYRHKNCASQFCIFTNEMKENESAVILNLLKHKWEPGLMYYFSSFLFQCKWFDLSMGPSIKYVHSNVGILTHFLPLECFKAIELRFFWPLSL